MLRGIVKWFNEHKGLGVIVPVEEQTAAVVVLSGSIPAPARVLHPGEAVAYELDPDNPNVVRRVIVSE